MRDGPKRQLFSVLLIVALIVAGARPGRADVIEELRAVKLVETAASAAENRESLARVEGIYRQILERHPGSPEARNAYGEFLWEQERFDEAHRQWQEAARIDPSNADALDHLGHCQLKLGNPNAAIGFFRRATAAAPRNAAYHYNLATSLFLFRREAGDDMTPSQAIHSALEHFRKAVELEPMQVEYARGYAETFYGIESPDWDEALKAGEHYLSITPDKDFARINLARIYIELKRPESAREILNQVQSPEYQRVKDKLLRRIETQ